MLLDEYVLLAVETQLHVEKETEIQSLLEKHMKTGMISIYTKSQSKCYSFYWKVKEVDHKIIQYSQVVAICLKAYSKSLKC